ncbi:hypothetical protein QQ44_01335 [Mycolicibacterium setense]|uniref:Uncharacterized protein n=1 Tax=Mycolicibacterium setense TaxID=431269 RepID=A0ABR4Z161_9MYCO|nr:hypothetical protein QQ44_01335 [Mycolicibacterium setense]
MIELPLRSHAQVGRCGLVVFPHDHWASLESGDDLVWQNQRYPIGDGDRVVGTVGREEYGFDIGGLYRSFS